MVRVLFFTKNAYNEKVSKAQYSCGFYEYASYFEWRNLLIMV